MSRLVLDSVLVADSGVAAVRVLRALQLHGVRALGVHTGQDASSRHARLADESVLVGSTTASYDDVAKLIEAARQARASGIHPGGRVLPGLEDGVRRAGLAWLGGPVLVPASWTGSVASGAEPQSYQVLPPRAVEVVSGVDQVAIALGAPAGQESRGGVAVSVDVVATTLAEVARLELPDGPDLWWDGAVDVGSDPVDPLLGVLTAWAPNEAAAWDRMAAAAARVVVEGPVVDLPDLVRRTRP